jgi:hypothetical protein
MRPARQNSATSGVSPSAYAVSPPPAGRSTSLIHVEVRIGVKGAPRELSIESAQSADEIEAIVAKALKDSAATVTLVDEKGRRVIVATDKLAYLEIAEADSRRVGFGAL